MPGGSMALLAESEQRLTGDSVEWAYDDRGDTGDGIPLDAGNPPEAKEGFVLTSGCWGVDRSFGLMGDPDGWPGDDEGLVSSLKDLHCVAFRFPMLQKAARLTARDDAAKVASGKSRRFDRTFGSPRRTTWRIHRPRSRRTA